MKIMISCRAIADMAGGVERMAIALMHAMLARGHTLVLLTWDKDPNAKAFYPMDTRIVWHRLAVGDPAVKAGWRTRWQRMKKIRQIVKAEAPDVIMAFQEGPFIALRFYMPDSNVPMICGERNAPQRFDYVKAGAMRHWYYRAMAFAHAITVQLPSYVKLYPWYLRRKMCVIPNPVFAATQFAQPAGQPGQRKTLLCIARLGYQKNQRVLIDAFSKIADAFPDWDLVFGGEGEDRPAMEAKIAQYELGSRITLRGNITDVSAEYVKSHLFCLPSRWEGFPNNLVEAFAHGLPAVGFADCAGIGDLIHPGVNGQLAEGMNSADTLAAALASLMRDDAGRARMGSAAQQQMFAYQPDTIFDMWEELFKKMAGKAA